MPRNTVRPTNPFIRFEIQELGQSIPSRFEHEVEKYPDRPAVRDKNRELTYKELDRAANRVARAILDQGTLGEEPVALVFDPGPQAIAAILGVLKSGKPYVFLDPGLSSDRNDFILKDSGARLMVSDAANFSKASSYEGLSTLNIDECPDASRWSNERLVVAPDSRACLVYTSGSTGVPKGVMYRTGDLGRRRSDGCLIHMGRKDHQVKIRGHRIEVAEIEEVLRNLDAVRETVVMPWNGPDGEPHLVAYFVTEAERTPSITALRRELSQKLPGYMVPAYFVQLDELPRAPGGKINRGALPSPGRLRPALGVPLVAPRNPTEVKLARLWTETLGLDAVGVHDPFLELGGDSLRAMQLISRIVDAFQIKLSVQTLLDSPTIADMAQVLKPGSE